MRVVDADELSKWISGQIKSPSCPKNESAFGLRIMKHVDRMPSAQPTDASCWGCNCPKMERLKEQKTFSEMVHLHDAETHEERTKTLDEPWRGEEE